MTTPNLDKFTLAYIVAALWSTNDQSEPNGGEPLDANYGVSDIAPETLAQMMADCAEFQRLCAAELEEDHRTYRRTDYGSTVEESAGHDFWLTRNGHGAGFWDGDWEEPIAGRLDSAAKRFGEFDLYVGDDGRIYS